MADETMVELVARAIAGCQAELGPEKWRYCLPEARSAIEAMREPTQVMLRAADDTALSDDELFAGPYEQSKAEWRAMISAALAERKEP